MANQQELTLQSIASERLFEVPDYQRPYAWETKQLADLWDDLDLMSSNRHYAGTLVLRQYGDPLLTNTGTSLTRCDVVDGQQRLTTCFLLLDLLRRRFEALDHEDAKETAYLLRTTYGVINVAGSKRPKLDLADELRDFWRDSILGNQSIGLPALVAGQRRLLEAREFFDAKLNELVSGLDDEEALHRLQVLNARITSGLRFLVYDVGDLSDVGVIFETLNERGKRLNDLEKIKNYLLYLARTLPDQRGSSLSELINSTWSKVFRHLAGVPGDQEDTVLRAHWLATVDPIARYWKRTDSVKAQFPRSKYIPSIHRLTGLGVDQPTTEAGWDALVDDVETYVRGLEKCAHALAELYSAQPKFVDFASGHERAAHAQAALRRTRVVALFLPIVFAARLKHPTDGELYADLLRLCETYAARVFVIAQRRSNAGQSWLNHIAHGLHKGDDPAKVMGSLRAAIWEYANDERVQTALTANENWYERRGHKYFFYEYELSLLKKTAQTTVLPYETFVGTSKGETTEHILPQHPGAGSPWWEYFTHEEHEQLRHTLGNLMLTHSNVHYSNKPYAHKRGQIGTQGSTYLNAAMAQEKEVAHRYEEWTPEAIRDRQRHLADWAMTRWAVTRPATGTVATIEDQLPDTDDADEVDDEVEEVVT